MSLTLANLLSTILDYKLNIEGVALEDMSFLPLQEVEDKQGYYYIEEAWGLILTFKTYVMLDGVTGLKMVDTIQIDGENYNIGLLERMYKGDMSTVLVGLYGLVLDILQAVSVPDITLEELVASRKYIKTGKNTLKIIGLLEPYSGCYGVMHLMYTKDQGFTTTGGVTLLDPKGIKQYHVFTPRSLVFLLNLLRG